MESTGLCELLWCIPVHAGLFGVNEFLQLRVHSLRVRGLGWRLMVLDSVLGPQFVPSFVRDSGTMDLRATEQLRAMIVPSQKPPLKGSSIKTQGIYPKPSLRFLLLMIEINPA